MKQIRTHVDHLRPLLTTTYNDAIKLDEQSAIENSPMLSVDKLSDNFSDENLGLKNNFKVVTICENLMLLYKIYMYHGQFSSRSLSAVLLTDHTVHIGIVSC